MIGSRLPRNRKFSYEPKYYDPKKEAREGRQIKFQRNASKKTAKNRSLVNLFVLLGIIMYFIYFLSKLGR